MNPVSKIELLQLVVTFLGSIIASSGFWLYITKQAEKKDMKTLLLLGLAHDRITFLGLTYIHRGWISQDEYENLREYLYKPYENMGGNGSARRIMCELDKLPIRSGSIPPTGEPC